MELIGEKFLSSLLIALLSLFFGYLPQLLARKYTTSFKTIFEHTDLRCGRHWTPSDQPLLGAHSSSSGGLLSLALHLAAGLLLTNCLCHWLPEVQEELAAVHT